MIFSYKYTTLVAFCMGGSKYCFSPYFLYK